MEGTTSYKVQPAASPAGKTATNLESISRDLGEVNLRTETVLRRLRMILARAHGPAPEAKAEGLKEVPSGVIGEMRGHIGNIAEGFREIDSALEVLESVI